MLQEMHLQAATGIELLIIIGVMIASAIYQAIAKRKQDAETWSEWDQPSEPPRRTPPALPTKSQPEPRPIVRQAPAIPRVPPPLPRPVILEHDHEAHEGPDREPVLFEQSQRAHERAASLQQRVETRFAEIDRQTVAHIPAAVLFHQRPAATQQILKSFRHPETIRQAFLASFVLNPPKALE